MINCPFQHLIVDMREPTNMVLPVNRGVQLNFTMSLIYIIYIKWGKRGKELSGRVKHYTNKLELC